MTLTKAELCALLTTNIGLNQRESKAMVDAFFDELILALVRGEEVKLANFGRFNLRDKNERPGRNPKTGLSVPVSARRVVTFRASGKLRDIAELAYSDLSNSA